MLRYFLMTKVRSGGCTIFIYYWNHITRGDCIYFLNFLNFFSSPLLILSVMTKKIVEWKRALTNELDENGWSPHSLCCICGLSSNNSEAIARAIRQGCCLPKRQRPWEQDSSSYCSELRPCGHSDCWCHAFQIVARKLMMRTIMFFT